MRKYGLILTVVVVLALAVPALADPLPVLTVPGLEVMTVTNTTATLSVTGGTAYGAPNGFTVEWVAVTDDWDGTWPAGGAKQAAYLGHGIAGSPFVLLPSSTVDITLGAPDVRPTVVYNPASSVAALRPDTHYAMRVAANSLSGAYIQSVWSTPALLTTAEGDPERPDDPHGPQGQGSRSAEQEHTHRGKGYWMNHEDWPTVQGVDYVSWFGNGKSWTEILNTPPKKGDTYYMLAHKYIAAKLNELAGHEPPTEVADAIAAAEAYFTEATPGVPANTEQGKTNLRLAAILASWGSAEDGNGALEADELTSLEGGPPAERGGPPEDRGGPSGKSDTGGPPAGKGNSGGKGPK